MSADLNIRLENYYKNVQFSKAFDESTNITDAAQLAVFVRVVNANVDIVEKFF